MKKIILFGAGKRGKYALRHYGKDQVAFFCDNSRRLQGTEVEGIRVISFSEMIKWYQKGCEVVVTPLAPGMIPDQLRDVGITDFSHFMNDKYRFPFRCYDERIKNHRRSDEVLHDLVRRSQQIDLIRHTDAFTELSLEALRLRKEEGIDLMLWGESNFYGNEQVLLDYAGIRKEEAKYFPVVSHEDCIPNMGVEHDYLSAVIMSGEYYQKKIHQYYPYIPCFTVGPYIQYAQGIYDRQSTTAWRERNGKTLVVFLPHSIEGFHRQFHSQELVETVIRNYQKYFDTIIACVYWADLGSPVCEILKKKGIKMVCAGFRFDVLFDRRIRTIMELADAVVCFDIGTFIPYAIWMGKPLARLPYEEGKPLAGAEHEMIFIQTEADELMPDTIRQKEGFYRLSDQVFKLTDEMRQWMDPYAGLGITRSKVYIRNVLEISKDIWMACQEDLLYYPSAVERVYHTYLEQQKEELLQILEMSTGNTGWIK